MGQPLAEQEGVPQGTNISSLRLFIGSQWKTVKYEFTPTHLKKENHLLPKMTGHKNSAKRMQTLSETEWVSTNVKYYMEVLLNLLKCNWYMSFNNFNILIS